jgi:hypothetical protein
VSLPLKLSLKLLPRTLYARLALIFFVGLLLANSITYVLIMRERTAATTDLMINYMEMDVASSVALRWIVCPRKNAPRGCRVWNAAPIASCSRPAM